ncbi:MAG: cell division FtsZ family protein [Deltaproteobacteria bacterium]|jgi:cell division protein FtsZ|nr:cell division FtsZ family protein [Deltaproteobacteria bacterium]
MPDINKTVEPIMEPECVIKVLGIGGAGNNAISHMVEKGMPGVELIAANTDLAHLGTCKAPIKIQLGPECSKGLGAGAIPEKGREACEESLPELIKHVGNANMIFVALGLGGGTGTGGGPFFVEHMAKIKDPPLIVSVCILPFKHERNRFEKSRPALKSLLEHSNSLICISNAKLKESFPNISLKESKAKADDILFGAVSCITEVIYQKGEFTLDFADVKSALSAKGIAIMGIGQASGSNRAKEAIDMAINSPLMHNQFVKGAKFLLINVVADDSINTEEYELINDLLVDQASPDVEVFSGLAYDNSLKESGILKLTVIATGLEFQDPLGSPPKPKVEEKAEVEEPIPLEIEPEIQINLASEPLVKDQAQPVAQGEIPSSGQLQQSSVSPPPTPQRKLVRLINTPNGQPQFTGGYNKYAANSIAEPQNMKPRSMLTNPPAPSQRTLPGQKNRGLVDAKKNNDSPYMTNKAN